MRSEEDSIEEFIGKLNVSYTGNTKYEDFVRANSQDGITDEECRRILNKMEGLGFIKIEFLQGYVYIAIQSLGRHIVAHDGYKGYLKQRDEKERIEKEMYYYAKDNWRISKNVLKWAIATFFIGLVSFIISIIWHYN